MRHILIIILFVITACQSISQQTDPATPLTNYRADVEISFNGGLTVYDGTTTARLPANGANLPITFTSPINIDRVQITSCGRQAVCQSGGYCDSNYTINKNWTGSVSNTFTYNYQPTPDEAGGMCPVYIALYSKQALTSWGFIGFYGDETLPGNIYCNGKPVTTNGITVCQTLAGLPQPIKFPSPVKYAAEKSCNATTTDNINFELAPSVGICRATFVEKSTNRINRAIILGYSSVLLRSN